VTGGDGRKQYDFNKVTVLGADVKGSIAVAEKVNQMNAELNELGEHVQRLDAAEKAAAEHAARNAPQRGFRLPGGKGDGRGERKDMKSLGDMLAEQGLPGLCQGRRARWHQPVAAGTAAFRHAGDGGRFLDHGQQDPHGHQRRLCAGKLRLPNYVEAATRPIQLLDIIPMFPTDQAAIKYMEETTRTHAAAELAEGAAYAESAFVFTERQGSIAKIGDSLPVTDEQLEDVAMMNGYINSRLTFGVRQRLDRQVLIGNGTAPNLRGIANVAGIQTQAKGADPVPDAFFKAMTNIRVTGRAVPTHHVMHPTDWQNVRLLRTADGVYIWAHRPRPV
jgi:hypothetical protein